MAAQKHKSIEIDLSGIELGGIKLFVQEGTMPPCVAHCIPPPCVTPCARTQSAFVRK